MTALLEDMSENKSAGAVPVARNDKAVRVVGIIVAVLGIVFLVAGVATYAVISSTLADEKITVSDDAEAFAAATLEALAAPDAMREEARWRAEHWFGVERMVSEYETVLFGD